MARIRLGRRGVHRLRGQVDDGAVVNLPPELFVDNVVDARRELDTHSGSERATRLMGLAVLRWALVVAALLAEASCSGGGAEGRKPAAGHVELEAAPSEVRGQCRAAAEVLGFDVPCPTQLPVGARSPCYVPAEPRTAPCVWGDEFFLQPVVPDLPDGYEGTESGSMQLVITASRAGTRCRLDDSQVDRAFVRGHDAEIFRCSEHEGLLAGHLLLSWSEAGEVFGVSLHGYSDENRRLVYRIADSIEVVEPTVESTPSNSVPAIELSAGSSSGRAQFEAADPKAHGQTITVTVQPATVDVDVEFETESGSMLRILSGEDERDCEARGDQRVCTILLPILEAQRPGTWTAIATKAEGPAASVKIDILWEEVSCAEGDATIEPCR